MSTIRKAIESCDASNEMEAVIKEQLETLIQLADKNASLAEEQIKAKLKDGKINDDLTVPISKVISSCREARAITTEGNADIVNKIAESISNFFNPGKEEIVKGISGIIGTVFDTLMGSGEGLELRQDLYVVAVEYPSVVRMDFSIWMRNTRAEGIRKKCKNAVSVVAYKSAVDIKKLDFATFVTIYSSLLSKSFGNNLQEVDKLLDAAESIYKRLGLNTSTQANMAPTGLNKSYMLDTGGRAVKLPANLDFPFVGAMTKSVATVGDF